ncbi:MAG TPA: substrate-binding domain-containing protein [Acidothermaceae bacterium]
MNKTAIRLVAVAAVAGLGIAGCSSKKASTAASSAPAAATTSAAPAATSSAAPAATSSAAPPASSAPAASGTVGVILPDTQSSTRWETADRPALVKAFAAAGIKADIQNALGDNAKFQSIAQSMIQEGVKVLIITSIDPATSIQVETEAKSANIPVIDYDRLVLGGSAAYYASYDGVQVGVEQGQCLVDAMAKIGKPTGSIIMIDGSPTDNNATLFGQGAHSVIDKSTLKKVSEQAIPNWDNTQAGKTFQQLLTANGNKIDGVYVMNDGMAGPVITVLKADGLNGKVPVTGQDATSAGLQAILSGDQTCTIYKDATAEATAAATLAVDLIQGKTPDGLTTSNDPQGKRSVPSILLKPELIDITTVGDPIKSGAVPYASVCTGAFVALCTKAGIAAS